MELTPADAKNILVLIARANITGQEAETVTQIQHKLVAIAGPAEPVETGEATENKKD